jgi:AcrR family transcriptional regulator
VSRAESPARIVDAAVRLGTAEGPSALTVQGVARAAAVSKALVLYHFETKATLLTAIVSRLGELSVKRLQEAAGAREVRGAWSALVGAECRAGELALLGALTLEPEVPMSVVAEVRRAREDASRALALRLLDGLGLAPRIPAEFLGRLLLRELDGLVLARARDARQAPDDTAVAAELDATLLALMSLGR